MRKIFLACPYSHEDPAVVEERFVKSNQVAAAIVEAGHAVFSQVSMSHPINKSLTKTERSQIGKMWGPVDAIFLDAMDELIIIDLPGWDLSSGIAREIEFYRSRGGNVSFWSAVEGDFK